MTRVAWLTDVHLNFVVPATLDELFQSIRDAQADAVLISGDIAESHDVVGYLLLMDEALELPIYFVLGNHDFYFGSIASVRQQVGELCEQQPNLCYLTAVDVVEIAPKVGLVGHDGWADGRIGDYEGSLVMLNDYRLIDELAGMSKADRLRVLNRLGDEAASHVRRVLPVALEKYAEVFLVTHVPPLREACWHEGRLSDDEWAPHFSCQAVGDAILEVMAGWPHRKLTVLCGHTHGAGETRPLDNVLIITGGAEYRKPVVTRVFEFR